ncbi:MAG: DUF4926 domain-containing protein [Pseudomonadota bacterium]
MYFKINDLVKLINDMPSESLTKGVVGVVVAEFSEPDEAYEVEFCNESGETIAQVALSSKQIEKVI